MEVLTMKPLPCTLPRLLPLVATLCLAISPPGAMASGGDDAPDNRFAPEHFVPAQELTGYAAGQLGVVQGSFWRVYQVLAWRALHGQVASSAELKALNVQGWHVGPDGADGVNATPAADAPPTGLNAWLAARATALGLPPKAPQPRIEAERYTANYVSYQNCGSDAFDRAATTLRDRLQRHGQPAVQAWLANQDAVFANCSGRDAKGKPTGPVPVPPLPANAPEWLTQDTAYQRAAAAFYAGDFVAARTAFAAIAADARSPWQALAPYLATRCLIRQATLMDKDKPNPADGLSPEARAMLQKALAELKAQSGKNPAATRLAGWVDALLRPAQRAGELAQALQTGTLGSADRVTQLADYLFLLDRLDEKGTLPEAAEPMTRWIGWMQSSLPVSGDAAKRATGLQRLDYQWRTSKDPAWLLPLAQHARQLGELKPDAVQAMRAVPATSPAWHSLQWHLQRLALRSGQPALVQQADQAIDAALAQPNLSPANRNRWLQLKLASARDLPALLRAAPRVVVDLPASPTPIPDEKPGIKPPETAVDMDFFQRIYRHLPLPLLATVPHQNGPQDVSDTGVNAVVFTRALLLEDWPTARRLAPLMAQSRATTAHLYQRLGAATTPADQRLAALLILVNSPEFNPAAVGNDGSLRYWGCGNTSTAADALPVLNVPAVFLTPNERSQLAREQALWAKLPQRTRWLADSLLPWAAGKPNDPEAPKALHFLVASTRNECTSDNRPGSGDNNHSRQAFELLHKLWPKDPWTLKTRYWY
jgi:hypothetical protein